ncbi:hypothetical protein EB74_30035 [Mycobacterium sp. SWH-M5]|uniref:PPE domain-containing protein n=1 Tax=Mycolicibacterium goodii TaxID=134601 RepID=UPI000938B603|nr:PPE domain-containing protein [Mycolicibacterium goodii]MBU8817539.1 PPE family protein [Mycolicibacterium goodii]OKH69406.1 hypothetical protein EB74_30035 [Mycobacterium sp. SWH-M5]
MSEAGALPPEINSGLVHGGAGPATLVQDAMAFAASAARAQVHAAELMAILNAARSEWDGSAADAATAQLQPLIAWFEAMAVNDAASAAQIDAAATSIASAIAGAPYPVDVTTNRVTQATLVATNFFGVNTPAINVEDARYLEMWLRAAFARGTSDIETAMATGSLQPYTPPPMPVNLAGMGAPAIHAASVSAAIPASRLDMVQQFLAGTALDGLLVRQAAGDVAHGAQQGRPNSALMSSAADQSGERFDEQSANPLDGAKELGTQQVGQLGGQMGGMLSGVAQLPAQMSQQLTQPLQQAPQMMQMPMQMLQPLMSSASHLSPAASGAESALGIAPGGFATGSGNLAAALTRPASGVGGGGLGAGGSGLRLPASALTAPSPPAGSPAGAAKPITPGTSGAGGPGMFGAPMHGAATGGRSGGSENKYAETYQLGPQVAR